MRTPNRPMPYVAGSVAVFAAAVFVFLFFAAPVLAAGGSGTYTSPVKDFGSAINYDSFSWTATTPASTSLVMRVRTCSDATCSTNPLWTVVPAASNGGPLPALNGTRYFQYQVDLATTVDNAAPTLQDVSVNGIGSLTSSAFDSTDPANIIGGLSWDENATLPLGSAVTVSLRTAATAAGLTSATWTDFTNSTAGCTKAASTVTCNASAIPASMKDGVNDQWVQYKVILYYGASAPTVTAVRVNYTAPFDFTMWANPSLGTVSPGQTATSLLTAQVTQGGSSPNPVTWSANTGGVAGVTVSFTNYNPADPCTMTTAQNCTVSAQINTTAGTPPSTYPITLFATVTDAAGAPTTRSTTFSLTVAQPFNYSMMWTTAAPCTGVNPCAGSAAQGTSRQATFDATQTAGISSEPVSFSADTGGVEGVSVNFSFGSCFPTCSPANTVTIYTTSSTPVGGPYPIVITGISSPGGVSQSITFNLTVTDGFNFSVSFDYTSGTTVPGGTASPLPTLTTSWISGTADSVSFVIDNPDPTHITVTPSTLSNCTFSGTPPPPPPTQTCTRPTTPPFTIVASGSSGDASPGIYPIRVTGTAVNSLQTQIATYTLTVTGPFEFLMQFDPPTGNARQSPNPQDTMSDTRDQGASVTQNVSVGYDPAGPSIQTVSFSVTKTNISTGLDEPTITVSAISDCTTSCLRTMFINTTGGATPTPAGTYIIRLTATGGGVTHSIDYSLTVTVPPFDYNMRGWAWSQNVGWISFNSQNCDTNWNRIMDAGDDNTDPPASVDCPPRDGRSMPNYGAHMDLSTYHLSGYAWSEMAGWITFDRTAAGTPPGPIPTTSNCNIDSDPSDGLCMAVLNNASNKIEGWARAISCRTGTNPVMSCDPLNDWGWIKMSNPPSNTYAVERDGSSNFRGFAWGERVFGWVSFSSKTCDIDGDGEMDRDNHTNPGSTSGDATAPPECPPERTLIPSYKVWTKATLPNAPPVAVNLTSNFLDRCAAPFSPTLNFKYRDAEDDPLAMYIINIYRASDNALIDGPIYVPGPAITDTFDIIPPALYDPAPNKTIDIKYSYSGIGRLQYGVIYYFTVEVRDPAHLN